MQAHPIHRCLAMLALLAVPLGHPAHAQPGTLPAAVPARTVAHAATAGILAATRAGARTVAVGEHGVVLLSDDAGKTFRQARSVPVDHSLTAVAFADARLGWAAGHGGSLLHTQDGGETWTLQRRDVAQDRPLFALHVFNPRQAVAVGLWSLVLRTDDGGATWQTVTLPVPEGAKKADLNLLGLFADGRGRLFATAERGMLLRSDDQGRSWTYLPTGYKGSLWAGLALADGSLLAGGLRGSLFRSSDDGRSWTRVETGSKSSITALAQVGDAVLAVGLDGLVLRSSDGAATVQASPRPDRAALTALVPRDGAPPLLFSRQGVVRD